MFKVYNKNTRTRCEIYSKLIIKTPERRHWRRSSVFTVNSEHISHHVPVFVLLTSSRQIVLVFQDIIEEDNLDWWSKYFASADEIEKCGKFLEKGHKTIQVIKSYVCNGRIKFFLYMNRFRQV